MYMPLVCLAVMMVFWFLQKTGILKKEYIICVPHLEEEPNTSDGYGTATHKSSKKINDNDDEFFARAAELNSPPLRLTGSEAGFELRNQETYRRDTTNPTTQTTCTL